MILNCNIRFKQVVAAMTMLCLISRSATAQESVVRFDPIYLQADVEGRLHEGILVSEEYFDEINTRLLELKFLRLHHDNLLNKFEATNENFSELLLNFDELKVELQELKPEPESWWSSNRGTIGLVSGVIAGVGLTLLIVYGVNEAR